MVRWPDPKFLNFRKAAAAAVKKIVSGLGGHRNAAALVTELTGHIWNSPAVSVVAAATDAESGESGGGGRDLPASGGHPVKADFIVKALITISKATTYDEEGARGLVSESSAGKVVVAQRLSTRYVIRSRGFNLAGCWATFFLISVLVLCR